MGELVLFWESRLELSLIFGTPYIVWSLNCVTSAFWFLFILFVYTFCMQHCFS